MNNNSSKKVLLVTNTLETNPMGGREMLQRLNFLILKEILQDKLVVVELKKEKKNFFNKISKLTGNIDGLNNKKILQIINIISHNNIDRIFIDGSNLGLLAKKIKSYNTGLNILTFFHNVEVIFFLGLFKYEKSFRSFLVFIVNYFAERNACKYSNELICLSKKDKLLINKIYKYKLQTHISPIALIDNYKKTYENIHQLKSKNFAIFVGTSFYANKQGILWFAKNVAPFIDIDIYVIGSGYQDIKNELEISKNVFVKGRVENLSEYYNSALFVIAPIFSGSGMKTKVAEALMYGKKIIGTSEAFIGYEDIINNVGYLCNNSYDFIKIISNLLKNKNILHDSDLRSIYLNKYSYNSLLLRFKNIFIK
jgi:polysaccharide biosynthesis protein PslH